MTLRRTLVPLLLCLMTPWLVGHPRHAAADTSPDSPILSLDPGGHTAQVDQVLFTPDGKQLISVGEDKAIRVWNADTGEAIRTIRGQVGDGSLGKLFAAALSPDGHTLAVGGFLHLQTAADPTFYIRLLDPVTGKVMRLIPGLLGPSFALAFSPDGQTLASGDAVGTLRLTSVQTGDSFPLKGRPKDTVKGIYGVAFNQSSRQVVTASIDGAVRLWDIAARDYHTLPGRVPAGYRCVTWSSDGRWIAAGGLDHTIHVWDGVTGAAKSVLTLDKRVNCIAFSPDGKRLAAGLGADAKELCDIRLWAVGPDGVNPKSIGEFIHHNATVQSIAFSPDSATVASAGGLDNDIYLWTGNGATVKRHFVSTGGANQDVAWSLDGTQVTWLNQTANDNLIRHTFSLTQRSLVPDPTQAWLGATLSLNGKTLKITDGGKTVQVSDGQHISFSSGDMAQCITWTPDGKVVVGSLFGLTMFDLKSGSKRVFRGHTAGILSVSVSPGGKYLASTSGDQTVCIWPLDPATDPASPHNIVAPIASLFVGQDREWVEWTHSGFYTCSTNGENIIGWQINKGDENAAEYYKASRFHATFYRDDILAQLLAAGDEQKAIALADAGRTEKTDTNKTAANLAAILPPTVKILDPATDQTVADPQVTIHVSITDPNHRPLRDLRLSDNGHDVPLPADGSGSPQEGTPITLTAPLTLGEHILSVVVGNDANAESSPVTVKITYGAAPPPKIGTPTLYLMSIGVSRYIEAGNALQFPAKDAGDIAAFFKSQAGRGKMFSKVIESTLTDNKAKLGDINQSLLALRKQKAQMGPDDYTIIFIAGHGQNDDTENYYFLPFDMQPEDIDSTGVDWKNFNKTLVSLPGKVILMLDTCHSAGAQGKIDPKDGYSLFMAAYANASGNNESPITIFASCGKGELSLESGDWNNGAFTKALLEGLNGKADADHNGVVTVKELNDYIKPRVNDLTKQQQNPELIKPISVSGDLPLAVVGPIVSHTASTGTPNALAAKTP